MYLHPEAQRLLEDIQHGHEQLLRRFDASEAHRRGLRAVYEALESALGDVDETRLQAPMAAGEWTPAQVLQHLVEHDQQIEEVEREGMGHVVEHGLEHARGLWMGRRSDVP